MDISLRPQEYTPRTIIPRGPRGIALIVAAVVLLVSLAGAWHFRSQRAAAQKEFQAAQQGKQSQETQLQSLQAQINQLKAPLSPNLNDPRAQTVSRLTQARVDWKAVFVALGQAASSGIKLNPTSVALPGLEGAASGANKGKIQMILQGTARSAAQVQAMSRRLQSKRQLFDQVALGSVADGAGGQTTFTLTVTLHSPPGIALLVSSTAAPTAAPGGTAPGTPAADASTTPTTTPGSSPATPPEGGGA